MAQQNPYNGLLIVNKPQGITSHTVVNKVRRLFNMKRVGHAGTLDPMATGVLVVLVGPTTRLSQFLMEKSKRYLAGIHLGSSTSTYDTEGEITAQHSIEGITLDAIQNALASFTGEIAQVPPMYSAIKINGQKLYKLARQGKEIERPARQVTIHEMSLTSWEAPQLELDVLCSAGTYIRSLAHDLGQTLGCGAHLNSLVRSASGRFTLDYSYTLEQLAEMKDNGILGTALIPPTQALLNFPAYTLDTETIAAVRNGQSIVVDTPITAGFATGLDEQGKLVAVLIPDEKVPGQIRPKIVFPPET